MATILNPRLYTKSKHPIAGFKRGNINKKCLSTTIVEANEGKAVAIFGINCDCTIQSLYKPVVDPASTSVMVGNLMNDRMMVAYGQVNTKDCMWTLSADTYADIPTELRSEKPLTSEQLEGTKWEGASVELGACMIPSIIPIYPQMEIPKGNLGSDECKSALAKNGPDYTNWGDLMTEAWDSNTDLQFLAMNLLKLPADEVKKYVSGYSAQDTFMEEPWFFPTVITDLDSFATPIAVVAEFFPRPDTPKITRQPFVDPVSVPPKDTSSSIVSELTTALKSAFKSSEDTDKEKEAKHNKLMLMLMFICVDYDESTGAVTNPRLPTFTNGMEQVLNASSGSQKSRLNSLLKTVFLSKPKTREEKRCDLHTERNMKVFTKPFLSAMLTCKFSTESLESVFAEASDINYASFFGQNDKVKVALTIQDEKAVDDEEALGIPDAHRKIRKSNMTVLGTVSGIGDIITSNANIANVTGAIINVPKDAPWLYTLFVDGMSDLKAADFKDWMNKKGSGLSHMPFVLIEFGQTILKTLSMFCQNFANQNVIDCNKPILCDLDCSDLVFLGLYVKQFYDKLNMNKMMNTIDIPIPLMTPSTRNPKTVAENALRASIVSTLPQSQRSFMNQDSQRSFMNQDSQRSFMNQDSNNFGKGPGRNQPAPRKYEHGPSDADQPGKRQKNERNDAKRIEFRKTKGFIIPKRGVNPADVIPSGMEKQLCFAFATVGYDCSKPRQLCECDHPRRFSDISEVDRERLFNNLLKKKSGLIARGATKDMNIDEKFKSVIGDASQST